MLELFKRLNPAGLNFSLTSRLLSKGHLGVLWTSIPQYSAVSYGP